MQTLMHKLWNGIAFIRITHHIKCDVVRFPSNMAHHNMVIRAYIILKAPEYILYLAPIDKLWVVNCSGS